MSLRGLVVWLAKLQKNACFEGLYFFLFGRVEISAEPRRIKDSAVRVSKMLLGGYFSWVCVLFLYSSTRAGHPLRRIGNPKRKKKKKDTKGSTLGGHPRKKKRSKQKHAATVFHRSLPPSLLSPLPPPPIPRQISTRLPTHRFSQGTSKKSIASANKQHRCAKKRRRQRTAANKP